MLKKMRAFKKDKMICKNRLIALRKTLKGQIKEEIGVREV
jgi:hypothetical protein